LIALFHVTAKEGTGCGALTIALPFQHPKRPLDPSACIAKSLRVTPCNAYPDIHSAFPQPSPFAFTWSFTKRRPLAPPNASETSS
jgi:hypothetical protein